MKKFNVFSLYAIGVLLAACTASVEDALTGNTPGAEAGGISGDRRQVEVQIRNQLVEGSVSTKADGDIATTQENEVTAMDVYVFAAETEYGEYTFQERLTYRAGEEVAEADGVTPFTLIADATNNAMSRAKLAVKKGLYVKLYCVANAPELYKLNEAGDAYELAEFQPLKSTRTNDVTEIDTPGIPTEKEFLAEYTACPIEPENPENVIRTPLLMCGNVPGCMDLTDYGNNTDIFVSMKLVRGVARFDIKNNAEASRLTIEAVGMTEGNATTSLFPLEGKPAPDGTHIEYPLRYLNGNELDKINNGTMNSAFYCYGAPEEACLLIKGKFTTNAQEVQEVTYKVPFRNLKDGNGAGISIEPNHRYTVVVHDAEPHQIRLSITVSEWEEGGDLDDFETDNENTTGMSEPALTNLKNSYIYDNKVYKWVALYTNTAENKFTVKISSNSAVECKMKFGDYSLTKAGTETGNEESRKWLDVECEQKKAEPGNSWSTEYIFTFSVSQETVADTDKSFPPVLINFVSAIGTARTIRVESLTYSIDGKTLANCTSYLNDGEYWYFDAGTGNYDKAMSTCPEKDGWYLPTMNDFRNMFRIDNWNTQPLLFNSEAYLTVYNSTTERAVDNSYLSSFLPSANWNYAGYPYQPCNSSHLYDYSQNYANTYDYYWSADNIDDTKARGIRLREYTYSKTTCRRSWSSDWGYNYYTSNSRGHYSSHLTYQQPARSTSSYKIRCVKRRPGNLVYPY